MSEINKLEKESWCDNKRRDIQFQLMERPPNEEEKTLDSPGPCQGVTLPDKRYTNDRNHLLKMFPLEVWSIIFQDLKHPSQLEKLINSSLFFRELFLEQRTEFMFPSVWRFMESEYGSKFDRSAEVLKLRRVCRTWCNVIDHFYESLPYHCEREMFRKSSRTPSYNDLNYIIQWQMEKIKRLLSHFHQTHGSTEKNPLVGRMMLITVRNEDPPDYRQTIQRILEKYGHHIWYCKLSFFGNLFPYLRVRDILRLMPNLKDLSIVVSFLSLRWDLTQSEIDSNPIPTLERLQTLRCESVPPQVFAELVRRNNHINTLDVTRRTLASKVERNGVISSLDGLKTLGVTFSFLNDVQFLKELSSHYPLTKLYLRSESFHQFPWEELYQTLEAQFKSTLKFLYVELMHSAHMPFRTFSENHKLDLPHLIHVELKLYTSISLDVLLPIKSSLTTLNISMDLRGKDCETLEKLDKFDDCINLFKCARGSLPMGMNIWIVLPELQTFTFRYFEMYKPLAWSYTREKWAKEYEKI